MNKLMEKLEAAKAKLTAAMEGEDVEAIKSATADVKAAQALIDAANEGSALIKSLGDYAGTKSVVPAEKARTLGEHFVKYRDTHAKGERHVTAPAFKTAGDPTTTSGLTTIEYDTTPVRRVAAPLTVLDLFARKAVSSPTYSWLVYSSTTGSVGTTSEGAAKNKLTYNYAQKTANLQKITGLIKVTDELFEDAPYMVDAINQDLVDDLNANRQTQAITTLLGTSGLLTKSVTYKGVVDIFKGILAAAADVEDATNIPCDAVVVTPATWLILRSAVDETGRFYAGMPFNDSEYQRLFEMTFIKSADVTANHAIVGAFARGGELVSNANGIRVESATTNDDDFEKNLISVRAETREILAVKRPGAFCNVTLTADPS